MKNLTIGGGISQMAQRSLCLRLCGSMKAYCFPVTAITALPCPAGEAVGPSAIPGISGKWSECHFAEHCADGVLKEHMLAKWVCSLGHPISFPRGKGIGEHPLLHFSHLGGLMKIYISLL